jgi:hypothetical protein
VYPRTFEDAAQELMESQELGNDRVSRKVAISFRKPFFAGQTSVLTQQLMRSSTDDGIGVCGTFRSEAGDPARPHAYIKMLMG